MLWLTPCLSTHTRRQGSAPRANRTVHGNATGPPPRAPSLRALSRAQPGMAVLLSENERVRVDKQPRTSATYGESTKQTARRA